MTIKFSTGLRNALAPFSTRPGYLHLYTGGQPPDVEFPPDGVLLCPPIPLLHDIISGGGIKIVSTGVILATSSGIARWARIVTTKVNSPDEDQAAKAVNDFTVGVFGSGADLILSNDYITVGDPVTISMVISQATS